ncbi:MAG: hypothetical protein S4CHLAM20_12800 [Chlamydiia bacterium]|nr:hypothetical protein [Chlamydiia bacterium]
MNSTEKMRMCPYCEGTVPLETPTCRFCGSSFETTEEPLKGAFREEDNSQYIPPYTPVNDSYKESVYYPENDETVHQDHEEDIDEEAEKGHLSALTLLSCGGMLLTLSLMLFFFSEHGRLVLEWKSRYWSLYMILGLPMLYYGFKKLKTIS